MASREVPHWQIPQGSIWCIGQHSKTEKNELEKRERAGELTKVRSSWMGISSLKSVYLVVKSEQATA